MTIVLPNKEPGMAGTSADFSDVQANDEALKDGIEELRAEFAAANKPLTWYTPKVIAAEESRTNTAYGTLTTADEIKSVVLPENGLFLIGYSANVKSSLGAAGRAAIFLGANQLKASGGTPAVQEVSTTGTVFSHVLSDSAGLYVAGSTAGADVTTGQLLGGEQRGGFAAAFAAPGPYDISVKFKATSGSVTAKERKLWIAVLG